MARRRAAYHAPYHAALQAELDRVRATHGFAVLYDCHSIRSHIPFLFDGTLPDFNIGTNSGAPPAPRRSKPRSTASARVPAAIRRSSTAASRAAGRRVTMAGPPTGCTPSRWNWRSAPTCTNAPWDYVEARAARIRAHLKSILETLSDWRPHERPSQEHPRCLPADRPGTDRQELADRSTLADADEQPAPGRGREPA
jgi:N-formylglutamate deformylase